jgi:hypothetical protein
MMTGRYQPGTVRYRTLPSRGWTENLIMSGQMALTRLARFVLFVAVGSR